MPFTTTSEAPGHTFPPAAVREHPRLRMKQTGETFIFKQSGRGPEAVFRFEWRLEPGKVGPGDHVHTFEAETFHVRQGRLQVVTPTTTHDLGPGDRCTVPAGTIHHFGHPGDEQTVVDVSLDGTRMEDQMLPMAVRYGDADPTLAVMPQLIVHLHHAMQNGASVPTSALLRGLMTVMAAFFGLFGVRPLPPVRGWDA